MKSKLPIGIQTFRRIREEGFYYVDKTGYARRLVDDAGPHYFLSPPRRFGKSLFVDTLKELFEGNERLFRSLAIHDGWNWSQRHPVVRLDFSGGNFKQPGELHASAKRQLTAAQRQVTSGPLARLMDAMRGRSPAPFEDDDTLSGRFATLLETLHRRSGRRVVVLVDEYDKPILDAIEEPKIAEANRDGLRGLYGTLKGCDAHVELTFITGVSKFSKVSLFSDLNNLTDLTLDPAYAAICGYTEEDLDTVFAPELAGLDRDEIRAWYNGYRWGDDEDKVYNPFCLLKLFRSRLFRAHWFETATPRFLIDTLLRRGFAAPELERVHASESLLSAFDVDYIAPEALLFQTGYLTIAEVEEQPNNYPRYRLGYPNREVRRGLNEHLLDALAPDWRAAGDGAALRRVLAAEDWAGVEALLRKLLAGIPHDWHRRNEIARYEGYWSSFFYSWFQASMDGVTAEETTSHGRLDLTVRLSKNAYLFEFKVAERSEPGAALAQLQELRYADKYRAPGRAVHLIGVEVSAETRAVVSFQTAPG